MQQAQPVCIFIEQSQYLEPLDSLLLLVFCIANVSFPPKPSYWTDWAMCLPVKKIIFQT